MRAKLWPYLQDCNVQNDVLIAQLTQVCAEESERDSKLGKHKVKMARVDSKVFKRWSDGEAIIGASQLLTLFNFS